VAKKIRVKKADIEWAKAVKERDHYTCQRCGARHQGQGMHAAHMVSRRYKNTRHDPEAGITLCFGCHMWCHQNPHEAIDFFRGWLGEEKYEALRLKAQRIK
jgi:hypothetical protein